jgi:hypothetical protein
MLCKEIRIQIPCMSLRFVSFKLLLKGVKETGAVPSLETLINGEFRVDLISNTLPVTLNCEIGGDVFLWQQSGMFSI